MPSLSRRSCLALLASAVAPRVLLSQQTQPSTRPSTRAASRPATEPATRPAVPTDRAAARAALDALAARAVRSGFGWGWAEDEEGIDLTRAKPPKGKPPAVDAAATARVGLLMLRASAVLGDESYAGVAFEAGRGALAVQTRKGQVRARGAMGGFAGQMDDPADVPDRRPTRLGLALACALVEADAAAGREPDPRLRGPCRQAAQWLVSQQTTLGGWASIYPPDAARGAGTKLLRLDDADVRDTALAVLLAADVLADRALLAAYDRAAAHLVDLRTPAGRPQRKALWCAAYKLDGDPKTRQDDFPMLIDLLATRHVGEAVLAGQLLDPGSRPPRDTSVATRAAALADLRLALADLPRDAGGDFYRRYDLTLRPLRPPPPPQGNTFELPPPPPPPEPPHRCGRLLATLDRLAEDGPQKLSAEWSAAVPIRRRVGLAVGELAPAALLDPTAPPEDVGAPAGLLEGAIRRAWAALGTAGVTAT